MKPSPPITFRHSNFFAQDPMGTSDKALPFFQVYTLLKCPVVGVCLTMEEQRKMVRKARMLPADALPFDIHEVLVSMTDEDNTLSRRVDALLRRKYEQAAAPLRQLPLLDFMLCWDKAFTNRCFSTELWAAATRVDLPRGFQRHIFGCVHMRMHSALEHALASEKQLQNFRLERQRGEEQFRTVKLGLAVAHKELRSLHLERDALQRQHARMQAENLLLKAQLSAAPVNIHAVQDGAELEECPQTAALTRSVENMRQQLHAEKKHHTATLADREILQDLVLQLQKELGQLLKSRALCSSCPEEAQCSCCPRRVLIVGGMTRMESLYRQLVEARGDAFEYHDGCPGGISTLRNSLQRADLVLCPVNCNSHRACLLVKDLCKKYKKNLHMMHSFSLSAVTKAIEAKAGGATIN